MNNKNTVLSLDKPRCNRCGKFKPDDELNGYNPTAPIGQKYKYAYCMRLADCNSMQANQTLGKLISHLK